MSLRLPGRPDAELVIVLDCVAPESTGAFWAAAMGYRYVEGSPPYSAVVAPEGEPGIVLLLQQVPEGKSDTKNRLHLDLRVPDLDAEVRRLTGLGARVLSDEPFVESGVRWHILADPEGNEFCVLRMPDR